MIRSMLVKEWMSPAQTIAPNIPLRRAIAIMDQMGVHCLVVVEAEHIRGIVTWGDLCHAMPADDMTRTIWNLNNTWDAVTVRHVMSDTVITIEPQESVSQAAATMLKHNISRLPVIDRQGQLVGILTSYDIYRMLVTARQPEEASHLTSEQTYAPVGVFE